MLLSRLNDEPRPGERTPVRIFWCLHPQGHEFSDHSLRLVCRFRKKETKKNKEKEEIRKYLLFQRKTWLTLWYKAPPFPNRTGPSIQTSWTTHWRQTLREAPQQNGLRFRGASGCPNRRSVYNAATEEPAIPQPTFTEKSTLESPPRRSNVSHAFLPTVRCSVYVRELPVWCARSWSVPERVHRNKTRSSTVGDLEREKMGGGVLRHSRNPHEKIGKNRLPYRILRRIISPLRNRLPRVLTRRFNKAGASLEIDIKPMKQFTKKKERDVR